MRVAVILPAAGMSRRFTGDASRGDSPGINKLDLDLAGKPVVLRSIGLFVNRPEVEQIVVAVAPDGVDDFRLRHGDQLEFGGAGGGATIRVVPGGEKERWETVMKALRAVHEGCTHVAVHDAARPLTSRTLIDRVFRAAAQHDAVIPGLPVCNTLKRVEAVEDDVRGDPIDDILGDGAGREPTVVSRVLETVPRRDLIEVQTPQVFAVSLLRRAYRQIERGELDPSNVTDDASLVEALGDPRIRVMVVEGESTNLKITRPEDADLAAALIERHRTRVAAETARKQLLGDDDD